jgi:hypothetical protein
LETQEAGPGRESHAREFPAPNSPGVHVPCGISSPEGLRTEERLSRENSEITENSENHYQIIEKKYSFTVHIIDYPTFHSKIITRSHHRFKNFW